MRIARFVVLGLIVAASASAVAMAVDKQGGVKQAATAESPEATVTVKGVLHPTADGYAVGSRPVSFGPPWYAAGSSLIKDRLGTSVTVTGRADDDEDGGLSVRTIDGITYRAQGRPPWAGGPKHAGNAASCKAKAKAAKAKAKEKKDAAEKTEKADDANGGPPPWAGAYGRRCKS